MKCYPRIGEQKLLMKFKSSVFITSLVKINLLKISGLALLVLALLLLSGCRSVAPAQTVRTPQIQSVSDMGFLEITWLVQDLRVMGSNHAVAMHNGETLRDGEIPSRYWSEPIKALHPIRVYHDVGNTVIVQVITNGMEYGKYIALPTSSSMPHSDFHLMRTRW